MKTILEKVYAVLLRLLPNFDISNWKSTIRHMVNEHSDYNSIGRWHGQETSDIVYRDTRGVLTNLLIENGYIEGQQWTESTIEYYVEVKTTTDSCKKPFYMGNSQYERVSTTCAQMRQLYGSLITFHRCIDTLWQILRFGM